jgi:hypothetical protein
MDLVANPHPRNKKKTIIGHDLSCPDLDLDHLPECADIEICTDLIIGYLDVRGICWAGYVRNKKLLRQYFIID